MARKKREEDTPDTGGWINTFADLMNLLLCFFVLLFSMSTVDADKYEQLVTSMTERINIFDGGGEAVGDGAFVSSGTDQLVSISEFFNEFENSGNDTQKTKDQTTNENGTQNQGSQSTGDKPLDDDKASSVEDEIAKQQAEIARKKAQDLYSQISEEARARDVEDQININIDKKNQFVQIALNGALLFNSGDAAIKKNMMPLMSKVGDILTKYKDHRIKIEGHTDNVPISGKFDNNMMLSTARANTVFIYLKDKKKIKPEAMEISGMGEYAPVAKNTTSKGRARNRRVEIKIYTK